MVGLYIQPYRHTFTCLLVSSDTPYRYLPALTNL